jgi:hypothetical protein
MFILESSYGAELVAICSDVEVSDEAGLVLLPGPAHEQ